MAAQSERRADVRWLHAAQFARERLHASLGDARVEDPLFACLLEPQSKPARSPAATRGSFTAEFTHDGVRLFGFTRRDVHRVRVELDDQVIRTIRTGGAAARPEFTFTIGRATLARFPTMSRLRVRAADGGALRTSTAGAGFVVHVPHGDGSLLTRLGPERTLDKKGALPPNERAVAQRRTAYLRLYARARRAFSDELAQPLFLMYGTLLGCWRDGDLIPGDDDFDVGYVSRTSDPHAVKQETFEVIERLVAAGFVVSFNRRGRLFRLSHASEAAAGVHLDVRPLWFQEGRVYAHNHFSMPSTPEDWLPAETSRLGEHTVLVPRRTELFLEGHYGPGWRVPDPAFTYYLDAIPRAVLTTLAQALITPAEYRALREWIGSCPGQDAHTGRFDSDGWDDLYPLDRSRRSRSEPRLIGGEHA